MSFKDPEGKKAYQKEYYQRNKEKLNKEKRKEYSEKNKEILKEKHKKYKKSPAGIKSQIISQWKRRGLKSDNYNELYDYYLSVNNCENCNVELVSGNLAANRKCLDHCHQSGYFRNILCNTCNVKRR